MVELKQTIGTLERGLLKTLVELIDHLEHFLVVGDIFWGFGVDLGFSGFCVVTEMRGDTRPSGTEFIPVCPAVGRGIPLRRLNDVAHRRKGLLKLKEM